MNTFLHEVTHCKQYCLFIKSYSSLPRGVSSRVFSFGPLCRRYTLFRKKVDSHCPWYIASLATRSMLLDNRLNISPAHFSALSRHLFKIEVWKDKALALFQPLLQLGCYLSTTQTSPPCFVNNTFSLWSVGLTQLPYFLVSVIFRKGLA